MNQNGTQEKIKIKFSSTGQTWSHSVKAAQDPGQLECNLKTRKKNIDLAHQWGKTYASHGGVLKTRYSILYIANLKSLALILF